MALLPIDRLEAGMTLKSDVLDRSGRLLLPADSELSEKLLKIFRTWGVTEADIVLGPDDLSAESDMDSGADPLLLAEAECAIATMFLHNDPNHPMIHELMRICLTRRLANGR